MKKRYSSVIFLQKTEEQYRFLVSPSIAWAACGTSVAYLNAGSRVRSTALSGLTHVRISRRALYLFFYNFGLWKSACASYTVTGNILCLHDLPSLSPNSVFRSFRSANCNTERSHWMGMPRITNTGSERARKRSLGEREGRSYKHRMERFFDISSWCVLRLGWISTQEDGLNKRWVRSDLGYVG